MPVSYGEWKSYPWKNELALQSERVAIHFAELMSESFDGKHNPMDMLDRAIVLSGFAMRRMFEKRLVTDKLAKESVAVRTFPCRQGGDFRQPYVGHGGGSVFENYSFDEAGSKLLKIDDIANEIIHSSQLMVVDNESAIPTGLLIASDWHLKNRLLHFTIEEFTAVVRRVLDDRVRAASDQWDPDTGKVSATRE